MVKNQSNDDLVAKRAAAAKALQMKRQGDADALRDQRRTDEANRKAIFPDKG